MAYSSFLKIHKESIWKENIGEIILSDNDGEYFWMLPEILLINLSDYCIASPSFMFNHKKWTLVFTPEYDSHGIVKNSDSVNLFLWMKDYKTTKESYIVHLGARDENEEINFCKGEIIPEIGCFGEWSFIDKESISSISYYGRTRIICRIKEKELFSNMIFLTNDSSDSEDGKIKNEMNNSDDNDKKQKNEFDLKGVDRLIENLWTLLLDERDCDVILKTSDHELHAHRIILQARSPVFASMFRHEMTEKKTGEIDISDCTTAAFKVFLQFLYTGKADDMSSENIIDLYYIADKYQVGDLKSDCVEFMRNSLSVDNFCDIMALSIRHTEFELQKFATTFFCRNIREIVKTDQWQNYIKNYPVQANELIIKAINA